MQDCRSSWFRWWLGGLLFGAAVMAAPSADRPNPNVVVLHGEKVVTLENPRARLPTIAEGLAKQTGYTFTIDPRILETKQDYSVLLRNVPLSGALSATGYVSHGVWARSGRSYRLRPPTDSERANDPERYAAVVDKMAHYLKDIDLTAAGIPENTPLGSAISGFKFWTRYNDTFAMFPDESMKDWQVQTGPQSLAISYRAETDVPGEYSRNMTSTSWWWKK